MKLNKKLTIIVTALAVGLLILTTVPTRAFQGVGGSPYAADLLVSGLNTGSLNPGQEHWYAYSRIDLGDSAYNAIILSLNFEAEGIAAANRVNFQVFTFNQVEAWLKDSSGPVDSLGLGTPASTDFNANTGERLWAGPVAPNEVYYVRIFNLSPSPVQFRLTALGQKNTGFEAFFDAQTNVTHPSSVIPASVSVPGEVVAPDAVETAPSVAASLPVDITDGSPNSTSWLLAAQAINGLPPQEAAAWLMSAAMLGWLPGNGGPAQPAAVPVDPNPQPAAVADAGDNDEPEPEVMVEEPAAPEQPVAPDTLKGDNIYPNNPVKLLYGPNVGRMGPKTEQWYTFTPGKVDDKLIENFSLTLFFTPGEPNLARHVTFELFTGSQYQIWDRGTPQDMEHFGVGSWISRDNDYITGERLWHGTVVDGDQYFIKITNDTNKWVDYYLYPDDIINIEWDNPNGVYTKVASLIAGGDTTPTGKDIGAPLVAQKGLTQGKLAAGEDIWFSYHTPNTAPNSFDFLPYGLELTHKPGTVAHYVNVEIYPYQEQAIWQRGDGDKMKPLGAGSFTEYSEINNSHTWQWDGHFVSNTVYFIRVRNDSPQEIDYELLIRPKANR